MVFSLGEVEKAEVIIGQRRWQVIWFWFNQPIPTKFALPKSFSNGSSSDYLSLPKTWMRQFKAILLW